MNIYTFRKFRLLFLLFLMAALQGCVKEWKDSIGAGPEITIAKSFENIKGINVGDKITLPIKAASP